MSTNRFESFPSSVVRVYDSNGRVVGSGFLLTEKYILTCAHVVAEALNILPTSEKPEDSIEIDFPHPNVETPIKYKTKTCFWLPAQSLDGSSTGEKEDIAILELQDSTNQSPEEKQPWSEADLPPLAAVDGQDLWGDSFRVFGFPSGYEAGVWAEGKLSGAQASGWIQMQVPEQTGYSIQPGFSGAPIWDMKLAAVVGIVLAADRNQQNIRTAFMIPMKRLISWIPKQFLSGNQNISQPGRFNPNFEPIIYAFKDGSIVPVLGAGVNLCDYHQKTNLIRLASILIERYQVNGQQVGLPRLGIPYPVCPLPTQASSWPPPKGCPFYDKTGSDKELLALSDEQRLAFAKVNLRLISQYMRFNWEDNKDDSVNNFYEELNHTFHDCFEEREIDKSYLHRVHSFFTTLPSKMLAKNYRDLPFKLIVTTNFDNSLEKAFDEAGQVYDVIFYLAEAKDPNKAINKGRFILRNHKGEESVLTTGLSSTLNFGKRPIILKLFGTWGREFVITEDHHINYLLNPSIDDALPSDLIKHLNESRKLFMGYSLYDSDLLTVLYRIWKNQPFRSSKEKGVTSWIVHQFPLGENQDDRLEGRFWENKQAKLIQSSLADFITNLEMGIEALPPC